MNTQKTYSAKNKDFSRKWYLVDARDRVLGRICTEISTMLRGKNKPQFTPHVDCGDFVIVINAKQVRLTGNKWDQKLYYRHSRHVGGLKSETAKVVLQKQPRRLFMNAVKGMLPRNRLSRKLLTKLKVYPGTEHPHKMQNPIELKGGDK